MFSWTFSPHKEHSPTWYLVAIVVVLILVVYGIVEQLYLMSVVSFLFAGVYLLMENNSSPTLSVDIDDQRIQVGASSYLYNTFSRFSIISIGDVASFLRLTPVARFSPVIDIPLSETVNVTELRSFLSQHLEEDKKNTLSNADTLIHMMKL